MSFVLDMNSTLDTAIAMHKRAGYESIERYNDTPYAHLFFRKQLEGEESAGSSRTRWTTK